MTTRTYFTRSLRIAACLSMLLGLAPEAVWANPLPGMVLSEAKISDTAGGFGGGLSNSDNFGTAVAALGDLDGDGVGDLAIGSPKDDDGSVDRGAVWILFMNGDGSVRSEQKISALEGGFTGGLGGGDMFGGAVAGLGDLDGDGVGDVAVGATGDDDGGYNRGAVWILFLNSDGTVKSHGKISGTEGGFAGALGNLGEFGGATAALGDLDGDGTVDLAVGAPRDDDGGGDRGAVWILFLNDDGTVKAQQKISSSAGGFTGVLDNWDLFGASVGALGDLDGDGVVDLAAGAHLDDDGATSQGALWILFLATDGTVKSHQKISETAGGFAGALDYSDQFGISVTAPGDLNGDGIVDVAVGALTDDDGSLNRGAVWILFLNPDGTVKFEKKISSTEGGFDGALDSLDLFGRSAAAIGDLNGDNTGDLIVGAFGDDDGGGDRGAVWLLLLDGGICGNMIIEGSEECDDGRAGDDSCCTEDCQFAPSMSPCRSGSGDVCDPDEFCTGTDGECQEDRVAPSTEVCRVGTGDVCDPDETCTGIAGQSCPDDVVLAAGQVCRDGAGDACNPDETCTGIAGQGCPVDIVAPAGQVCRVGSGDVCDPGETCTGIAGQGCPVDARAPVGQICRDGSGDACDPAETCNGVAGQGCPDNVLSPAGQVCRAGSGDVCNPGELCTGVAGQSCPVDVVASAGQVCRLGSGDACDFTETCTGEPGQSCPADVSSPPGTSCADDGNACTEDVCGNGGACEHIANAAPCDDGNPCTAGDVCGGGACVAGVLLECNDGDACTVDVCADGCQSTTIPMAWACYRALVGGSADEDRTVEVRLKKLATVDGDVCGDTGTVGFKTRTLGSSWLVTEPSDPQAVLVEDHAVIDGDLVTGGGGVAGVEENTNILGTGLSEIFGGQVVPMPTGGLVDTTGLDTRVDECREDQADMIATASQLDALPATAALGAVSVTSKKPTTIAAIDAGGPNVFDLDSLDLAKDATLTLDGGGHPATVLVLRIDDSVKTGKESAILLAGGLEAERAIIYSRGRRCSIGQGGVGSGLLLCPNANVQIHKLAVWTGAIGAGGAKVELGDRAELRHVPFLGTLAP